MKLDRKKGPKNLPFFYFFHIFSKMVFKTKQVSLSLNSVDQDTSYKPSNTLWTWTVLKKIRKNCKKGPIFSEIFDSKVYFFSITVHRNEFRFFALQSVHQYPSFELSNSTIRLFSIFTLVRGDPLDLGGGLSATPRGRTGQKRFPKCFSWTLWHPLCI